MRLGWDMDNWTLKMLLRRGACGFVFDKNAPPSLTEILDDGIGLFENKNWTGQCNRVSLAVGSRV